MAGRATSEQRLAQVLRLRDAHRRSPADPDITAVLTELEGALPATVSRSSAARMLGVSHVALNRWAARRAIPTVIGTTGRVEVPVRGLLRLAARARTERARGHRHVLERIVSQDEVAAESARTVAASTPKGNRTASRAIRNGRAYHAALAARLTVEDVSEARRVLQNWTDTGRISHPYRASWDVILQEPLEHIASTFCDPSPEMDDLRQSSPFAGMLSETERLGLLLAA